MLNKIKKKLLILFLIMLMVLIMTTTTTMMMMVRTVKLNYYNKGDKRKELQQTVN